MRRISTLLAMVTIVSTIGAAALAAKSKRPPETPAAPSAPAAKPMDIKAVHSFMYQLQNIEKKEALEKLAASSFDLLVVEPSGVDHDTLDFDMAAMVRKLHEGKPGRIVLAYLDVGEAEKERAYWPDAWKAPTKTQRGDPDFLLIPDPDGWTGDFPVAYWDTRWQEIVATGQQSVIRKVMSAGFDGLYLDWIDGFDDETVSAAAKKQKVDPAKAMVDWIGTIRKSAREVNPGALIVAQNAFYLNERDPRYLDVIDGLGVEDTWFSGKANTKWGKPKGGDIANKYKDESSTAARLQQYKKYQQAGKPVFTIDYCLKPENVKHVYEEARKAGLIPLVTQVSLERMTETPPP
jgi:cysteinyl-tRNA synthetase